ncbi:MAG: hypothetical protein JNM02_11050 [Anaerolineales bacterium]|nr:hypothetical protein [Anaerolineales bacterium]
MKRIWLSMTFAIGLSLLYTGVVYAQGAEPPVDPAQTGEIAAKLAGLLAAATLIERIIEMVWDFVENSFLTASKAVGNVTDYVSWAQKQVQTARANLISAENPPADEKSRLETELIKAEDRLSEYHKSPVYVTFKKKLSVPFAIILGLIIAWQADLQMFALLGILPAGSFLKPIDIIITGLVIGTGSAPVHSLIGILQNTKDTIDSARAMYTGRALADVIKRSQVGAPLQVSLRDAGGRNVLNNLPDEILESLRSSTAETPLEVERAARRMLRL